eukprot:scaffold5477_cov115-Pinguiococcus_pyrenoidosus.AAC.1
MVRIFSSSDRSKERERERERESLSDEVSLAFSLRGFCCLKRVALVSRPRLSLIKKHRAANGWRRWDTLEKPPSSHLRAALSCPGELSRALASADGSTGIRSRSIPRSRTSACPKTVSNLASFQKLPQYICGQIVAEVDGT